jgi:hypothetical protein
MTETTKRITQATFDETVKNNMEDFGWDLQQAILETINQFSSQGVVLKNIDTSGGLGLSVIANAITVVIEYANDVVKNGTAILSALQTIRKLCSAKYQHSERNINIILHEGCLAALYKMLEQPYSDEIISAVLETIASISRTDGLYLNYFMDTL